ncbi:FtsW/RodA/SpoVE family cell cycle protein [Aliamphritea spongicola]|nr:FtsW/RodA/SpoVE family cell cycle protein [Aliamphritea spongicola]
MSYVAYGFGIMLAAQALINIGVNVGALPTKGLTLPLLSYGAVVCWYVQPCWPWCYELIMS